MSPPPSPFPSSPAAGFLGLANRLGPVGPIGAWDGDDAEGPTETAAAQVTWGIPGEHGSDDHGHHPSILSNVIAGERLSARDRCQDCQHPLTLNRNGSTWCPSCDSDYHATTPAPETPPETPSVNRIAAALQTPVSPEIAEHVMNYHRKVAARTQPPPPPAKGTLTWDARIMAFRVDPQSDSPLWQRAEAEGIAIEISIPW